MTTLDGDLPRRVWYITSDWFEGDTQARFHALEQSHPLQTVLGDCTRYWCFLSQLMEAPPNATPEVFGGQIGFYGADIDEADRDHVRARLWWKADSPVPLDYSIGLQMLDGDGRLVAQSDGAIYQYAAATVQTSQMEPGQIYIDFRNLTPTDTLPAGEYRLLVVVYQSWDGTRLTVGDGRDAVEAGEVSLQ